MYWSNHLSHFRTEKKCWLSYKYLIVHLQLNRMCNEPKSHSRSLKVCFQIHVSDLYFNWNVSIASPVCHSVCRFIKVREFLRMDWGQVCLNTYWSWQKFPYYPFLSLINTLFFSSPHCMVSPLSAHVIITFIPKSSDNGWCLLAVCKQQNPQHCQQMPLIQCEWGREL